MRKRNALLCLLLSLSLTACGLAGSQMESQQQDLTLRATTTTAPTLPPPKPGYDTSPQYSIDARVFTDKINQYFRVDNKVKGFQVTLIHKGSFKAQISGGYGTLQWKDEENPQAGLDIDPMTTSHYSNVGSAAKFPSAIGLLASMESKPLGAAYYLNKKIWNYLPKPWQDISHPSIQWITFRDLLSHKSGLPTYNLNYIRDILKVGVQLIKKGNDTNCTVDADNVPTHELYCHGVRNYSNLNFKLLGYLTASFDDPALRDSLKDLSPLDHEISKKLGAHFEVVMEERVFSKVSQGITPSCHPVVELMTQQIPVALMYTDRSDFLKGLAYSTKNSLIPYLGPGPHHCRAQGGWYYSSRAMGFLLDTLENTDKIIPRDLYKNLAVPYGFATKINNRIAWASRINLNGSVLQSVFGWNYAPYHDGSHPATLPGRKVHGRAAIVRLPMGYHAVGIINSDGMNSSSIAFRLKDAFVAALVSP